jgi:hypothetical protein
VCAVRLSDQFACWGRHHEVVAHAPPGVVSELPQPGSHPEGNRSCGVQGLGSASRLLAVYPHCEGLCGPAKIVRHAHLVHRVHRVHLVHRAHHAHPCVRDRAAARNARKRRGGQELGRLAESEVCLAVYPAVKWVWSRSCGPRNFVASSLAWKTWEYQWQVCHRADLEKAVWQATSP